MYAFDVVYDIICILTTGRSHDKPRVRDFTSHLLKFPPFLLASTIRFGRKTSNAIGACILSIKAGS